jgi:hypothetical protein
MTGKVGRRWRWAVLLVLVAAAGLAAVSLTSAAPLHPNPNEREVDPAANVKDPDTLFQKDGTLRTDGNIWVLHFRFKDLRMITVDIPGRGRTVCWYLWYQVINKTGEPRRFIPDFELVTLDRNTRHRDKVFPAVQQAIMKLEDPSGVLDIKNSVTIASEPIPPTRPESLPRAVTGVAIWDDVNLDTNRFDIYVAGLSNGWAVTDPILDGGDPVVRRKTLRLSFERPGDRQWHQGQIKFMNTQWLYRGSELPVPGLPKPRNNQQPAPPPGN